MQTNGESQGGSCTRALWDLTHLYRPPGRFSPSHIAGQCFTGRRAFDRRLGPLAAFCSGGREDEETARSRTRHVWRRPGRPTTTPTSYTRLHEDGHVCVSAPVRVGVLPRAAWLVDSRPAASHLISPCGTRDRTNMTKDQRGANGEVQTAGSTLPDAAPLCSVPCIHRTPTPSVSRVAVMTFTR